MERADLLATGVGIVAFLGLTTFLGLGNWWVAGLAAVGVYTGMRLLTSQSRAPQSSPPNLNALLDEVATLASRLGDLEIRSVTLMLNDRARAIRDYAGRRPEQAPEVQFMLTKYVEQTRDALRLFGDTEARSRVATRGAYPELKTFLDRIETGLAGLYQRLASEDESALRAELEVMNATLADLNEVSQTLRTSS